MFAEYLTDHELLYNILKTWDSDNKDKNYLLSFVPYFGKEQSQDENIK